MYPPSPTSCSSSTSCLQQRRVDQVPRSLARRLYAAVVGTHDDVVPYVVLLRGLTRVFKTATPRERSAIFLDVVLDTPRAVPDRVTRAELRRALGWLLMAAATFREPAMEPADAPTPGRLTRDEEERWLPELLTTHQRVVDPILRGCFPEGTDAVPADIALDDLLNWQLAQVPKLFRLFELALRSAFAHSPATPLFASTTSPSVTELRQAAAAAAGLPPNTDGPVTPSASMASLPLSASEAATGRAPRGPVVRTMTGSASVPGGRVDDKAPLVPGPVVPDLDAPATPKAPLLSAPLAWLFACALPDFRRPLNDLADAPWKLLFSAGAHGYSLRAFERRVFDYPGPTLVLVQAMDGTVSGACVSDPWKAQTLFSSVDRACLFDVLPVFRAYPTVPPGPKAERNHVYYNAETATNRRQGIGFGGSLAEPRLWIDNLLQNGHINCANCKTFLRPAGDAGVLKRTFGIAQVEVWGLGGKRAEEYQRSQRQWEDRQVERAKAGTRSEWGVERMLLEMLGRTTHLDDQRLAGMRAPIDEDDGDV